MHRYTYFLRCMKSRHDLGHLFVNQRYDRRAAFVDGVHAFLDAKPLAQDFLGVIDLAAARAGEVATKQRFKHEHQRILLATAKFFVPERNARRGIAGLMGLPFLTPPVRCSFFVE